jgi:hypothetical protein
MAQCGCTTPNCFNRKMDGSNGDRPEIYSKLAGALPVIKVDGGAYRANQGPFRLMPVFPGNHCVVSFVGEWRLQTKHIGIGARGLC